MKLLELEIKNLKSITTAKLSLPPAGDHQVSLLYGDNGAGKTTVLEAISLLGHLSTMRRVCVHGTTVDMKPSRFRESKNEQQERSPDATTALRTGPGEDYDPNAFADEYQILRERDIDAWWRTTAVSGDRYQPARIRYVVHFQGRSTEFFISFIQHEDLSITEALSRDQNGPGGTIHDGNMDNWFEIVYDLETRTRVEALIEHMYQVSPHSYRPAVGEYRTDSRLMQRPESHSIVAYWNTDLNDFGRKNDLRESVKKIRLDFRGQMIDRLGLALPYSADGTVQYHAMGTTAVVTGDKLIALNDSLKRALVDHAVAMQNERRKSDEPLIKIAAIDARIEPARMRAKRFKEKDEIEIDHLSAGENESVFIFLLMHGMPCRDSIILLDEPDLHLSDFAKAQFYEELYRVAAEAKCQLIISTHSAFAYMDAPHFSHFFIRRAWVKDPSGTQVMVYKTTWTTSFGELLTFHYARCAINAMSQAGLVWKLLSGPLRLSISFGERAGVAIWASLTIFVASFMLYATLATLNDVLLIVDFHPELHKLFIKTAFAGCLAYFAFCFLHRFINLSLERRAELRE